MPLAAAIATVATTAIAVPLVAGPLALLLLAQGVASLVWAATGRTSASFLARAGAVAVLALA